ncbi:methionyl-tRNA formyltransferase [Modestobacter marinus]|uniref:methionyl-tRNA formyltransferase n=1 Tax=Modestobacter marinus TaxID=477641 RepID=UPI001C988198|nr:methionyl-tRNA formyltransferase [Modestobacter marinus]
MSSDRRGRVLLVGQGPTSATALRSLTATHEVVGLVRKAPAGDAALAEAVRAGVPVHEAATVRRVRALVHELQPECVVVSSYDRVLPEDLLDQCRFVNVHYSPLPRYRGRANVIWAVINGEPEAAISVHEMVPGLDAGRILYQERVPIGPRTTTSRLYGQLNALQERELGPAVSRFLAGHRGVPQDETQATYGCTRVPDDGELDWSAPTAVLDRLVRGLTAPAPGAFTFLGLQRLWVDEAEPAPEAARYEGRVPGRVVRVCPAGGWVDVLTGDGVLRLHRVRLAAGARVPAADVLRSVRATLGLRSTDLVRELTQLRAQLASGVQDTVASPSDSEGNSL